MRIGCGPLISLLPVAVKLTGVKFPVLREVTLVPCWLQTISEEKRPPVML